MIRHPVAGNLLAYFHYLLGLCRLGHEVFYITAPDTTLETPTMDLAQRFFPKVPVRSTLAGNASFFSSAKAERMLGWRHQR